MGNTKKFTVPSHWRVFVLDDTEDRLRWFRRGLAGIAQYHEAKTAAAAIEILSTEPFDLVFLDHDLSWEDAADSTRLHGNGKEVARYLARTGFAGRVVIHSKNEEGVDAMRKILPAAMPARFGDFEVAIARAVAR
jgi:response regulator RpfG family c-di-GMP phosphodiesterase